MVSGKRNTLASPMVFLVPARLLAEGTYALMGRLSVTAAGDLGWSARTVSAAGATTIGSSVVVSGATPLAVTDGYEVVNLAALVLPVVPVEGDQMLELTLTGASTMTVDEALLFNLADGALTWVRDTAGLTWIEIRSPEMGSARPSVYAGIGPVSEGGTCIDWACRSFGSHRFEPGPMGVYTLTTDALASQSELEYFERYLHHVPAAS